MSKPTRIVLKTKTLLILTEWTTFKQASFILFTSVVNSFFYWELFLYVEIKQVLIVAYLFIIFNLVVLVLSFFYKFDFE